MRKQALAACAVGAVLAGCGGGSSDEDQVKSTIKGAYSAFADGNADGFCSRLSKDFKPDFEENYGPCTDDNLKQITQNLKGGTAKLKDPEIGEVKVDGDQADPEVNGTDLELVKEDGEWKLDDFDLPSG